MKVLQIGVQGVYRYDHGLYENTKNNGQGIEISHVFMGSSPTLGSALPLTASPSCAWKESCGPHFGQASGWA